MANCTHLTLLAKAMLVSSYIAILFVAIVLKKDRVFRNTISVFIDYAKSFDCKKLWKIPLFRWEYCSCILRNFRMQWTGANVRTEQTRKKSTPKLWPQSFT